LYPLQVGRDHAVKSWKFIEGEEYAEDGYGSGYPAGMDSFFENFICMIYQPL
jgi:hypothetical protein